MARKKYGFSFSAKRALGISKAKRKISKTTKIPLTKQGRRRKAGRLMGCSLYLYVFLLILGLVVLWI